MALSRRGDRTPEQYGDFDVLPTFDRGNGDIT